VHDADRRLLADRLADLAVDLLALRLVGGGGRLVDEGVHIGVGAGRRVDRSAKLDDQGVEVVRVERALLVGAGDLVVAGGERLETRSAGSPAAADPRALEGHQSVLNTGQGVLHVAGDAPA